MTDATSFYRGAGPISRIRKKYGDKIRFSVFNEINWATLLMNADGVFIQRPFNDQHYTIVEMAKDLNLKLWVDYDDDLFQVPTDNPAHKIYNESKIQKNVAKIIAMADHVSVTTEHLKKQFQSGATTLNRNITVVPNAYDFDLFPYRSEELAPRQKIVMWRGSATHHRDVMSCAEAIVSLSKVPNYSDWLWRMIGDNLWFVTDYMPHKNVVWSNALDTIKYQKHIYDIAPKAIIVPLHDSSFNKSKSNIAWIEGTFAGAVTIAPDWDEWRRPGVLNYKDPEDFKKKLNSVMAGALDTDAMVKKSWEDIKQNYNVMHVNERRVDIIEEIVGGKIR